MPSDREEPALTGRVSRLFGKASDRVVLVVAVVAVIAGGVLLWSFKQFNDLHEQFFSANFDAIHNARALLKTRMAVDKFAIEIQDLQRYRDLRRKDTAHAQLVLAQQYEQTLALQANDVKAWLPKRLNALERDLTAVESRLGDPDRFPESELRRLGKASRELVTELEDAERDRWAMLSALNTELGGRIQKSRIMIAATGGIFALVAMLLAWLLFVKQRVERRLQGEIAERRQTELRLKEVIGEHQVILDQSPVGIALVAPDQCRIVRANQRLSEMTGYSLEQLAGMGADALIEASPEVRRQSTFSRLMRGGEAYPVTVQMRRQDGSEFSCKILAQSVGDDPQRGAIWIYEDITELERAQAHLVESEKMAALGQLVAGVAHEINTPIGVAHTIVTNLTNETREIAEKYHAGRMRKADLETYMELAVDTARMLVANLSRAAGLIRSFKQVAVDQSSDERRPFNLDEYLREIITSLTPQLKRSARLVDIDCPGSLEMDSFPGALSQVVANLVMNALMHAFEDGQPGEMTLAARAVGDWLELRFADNGCGIPAEHLPRIFDPFFTTRRGAGGSGLGLNIVYNLVTHKLGGSIVCRSKPGMGTTFIITIPIRAPQALNGAESATSSTASEG